MPGGLACVAAFRETSLCSVAPRRYERCASGGGTPYEESDSSIPERCDVHAVELDESRQGQMERRRLAIWEREAFGYLDRHAKLGTVLG